MDYFEYSTRGCRPLVEMPVPEKPKELGGFFITGNVVELGEGEPPRGRVNSSPVRDGNYASVRSDGAEICRHIVGNITNRFRDQKSRISSRFSTIND